MTRKERDQMALRLAMDYLEDAEAARSLCDEVERLIRGDAHKLIAGRADSTARLIVAQLAHKHGLVPLGRV